MDLFGGTGIVKTALQTHEFVKPVVENLIPVLAQLESVGNLAYTRVICKHMALKNPRRWKFEAHQKEQRQAKKAATDLLVDLARNNTWVLWGDGGFGPTSRGHAAAPNKKSRALLNRHLTNEYGSSKTPCCHGSVKPLKQAVDNHSGYRVPVSNLNQHVIESRFRRC